MKEKPLSYNFIITNWLFMYLNESECIEFAKKSLTWLKINGFIFIRESCYCQSGNKKRTFNPTFYRSVNYYYHLFNETIDDKYKYKLKKHGYMECYKHIKNNKNQLYWLFQKVEN